MTWGWNTVGATPNVDIGTGTVTGGSTGTPAEARQSGAWPRYQAEYLKRAITSDRYKYDTDGLGDAEKSVYLDKITADYKAEADEVIRSEFNQWLTGQHECNDVSNNEYVNEDGKPVRRWVARSKESEGKVTQSRSGWRHTPWGRAPLTHLPGVKEYLRGAKESADDKDLQMQLLAEYGPQDLEQAWMYFKHWVKGRPLSDAVPIQPHFENTGDARTIGDHVPERMYHYDSEPPDRQPGVQSTDINAPTAAVSLPGEKPVLKTTDRENAEVHRARQFRERMEEIVKTGGFTTPADRPGDEVGEADAEAREARVAADARSEMRQVEKEQAQRQVEASAPTDLLLPGII